MYTEKSAELKNDFYCRYGETAGSVYFERTGIPCTLMESNTHSLMFAMDCSVRAYGRKYGDVLKIMDAGSNVCDIHFVKNGRGAQILYSADTEDIKGTAETKTYTIEKLLRRMVTGNPGMEILHSRVSVCDRYGSGGWCAYVNHTEVKSLPLPLMDYNVMIIRTHRKGNIKADQELLERFYDGETKRIEAAAEGLKKCRIEVLFSMMNESFAAMRNLFTLPRAAAYAAELAAGIDGVRAVRVDEQGVICITDKALTDAAARAIIIDFERKVGYSAGIIVVK